MKLSRSEFKNIVKECLVEILSEGMGNSVIKPQTESFKKDKLLSPTAYNKHVKKPSNLSNSDPKLPHVSTGNPILDEMLLDTAKTTLPSLQEAEMRQGHIPPSGGVEKLVSDSEPQKIFGDEAVSKWAALAFNEIGKKF